MYKKQDMSWLYGNNNTKYSKQDMSWLYEPYNKLVERDKKLMERQSAIDTIIQTIENPAFAKQEPIKEQPGNIILSMISPIQGMMSRIGEIGGSALGRAIYKKTLSPEKKEEIRKRDLAEFLGHKPSPIEEIANSIGRLGGDFASIAGLALGIKNPFASGAAYGALTKYGEGGTPLEVAKNAVKEGVFFGLAGPATKGASTLLSKIGLKGSKVANIGREVIAGGAGFGAAGLAASQVEQPGKMQSTEDILTNIAMGALLHGGLSVFQKPAKLPKLTEKPRPMVANPAKRYTIKQMPLEEDLRLVPEQRIGTDRRYTIKQMPPEFMGNKPKSPIRNEIVYEDVGFNINKANEGYRFEDPEFETRYTKAKGIKEPTIITKTKEAIKETINKFTRPFATLPVNKENADISFELIRLAKIRRIAGEDAIKILENITKGQGLDKSQMNIFSRKVLLDDLLQESKRGHSLPFGTSAPAIEKELSRITSKLTPNIRKALDTRNKSLASLTKEYIKVMGDLGIDVRGKISNKDYFRHQVLKYFENKGISGTGKKLSAPTRRGFLHERSGTYEGDINTDYFQAEYEMIAQMKHDIELAKTIKNIKNRYDISDRIRDNAEMNGIDNWRDSIPDGYTLWRPQGIKAFNIDKSFPEKAAESLLEETLSGLGVSKKSINKIIETDNKNTGWVIKNEIAETLDNLFKRQPDSRVAKIAESGQNFWKRWQLTINPYRTFKVMARNFSGDFDAAVMNPKSLRRVGQSMRELADAFKYGKYTKELLTYRNLGGFQSLTIPQEISGVSKIPELSQFRDKTLSEKLFTPIKKYIKTTEDITNYRELILRYANYLEYKQQITENQSGIPDNFGASNPDVIKGLSGVEKKAFKLSNDLMGAYDEVSEAGKTIRKYWIPFYSWMETNMRRYNQIIKNAFYETKNAETIGKKLVPGVKMTVKTATSIGKMALKVMAFSSVISIWNNTVMKKVEESLPKDVRARPHLNLGTDAEGNPLYFSRIGALNDYLEWFGLGTVQQDIVDIMNGKRTLKEQAIAMAKQPLNKLVSGLGPYLKTPLELATGQTYFPDVSNPRDIKNIGQYLANSMGLKKEYDKIFGFPSKPYSLESAEELFLYKTDAKKAAYDNIRQDVIEFRKKIGKYNTGFSESQKSDALYNFKLALKYEDKKSAEKFLKKYIELGGTARGFSQSIKSMHPLGSLGIKDRSRYIGQLGVKDKEELQKAIEFYHEILKAK